MSTTLSILAAIALVTFIVWSVRGESRAREMKIEETFSDRESLTPEAFYEHYFLGLGIAPEVVIGIRNILEEQLDAVLKSSLMLICLAFMSKTIFQRI